MYANFPTRVQTCRHCKVMAVDSDQPESHLCPACLDDAVWANPCFQCGKVPTGKRSDDCD